MIEEVKPTLLDAVSAAVAEVTTPENNNGAAPITDESTVDSGADAAADLGDGAAGDSVDAGGAEGDGVAGDAGADGAGDADDAAGEADEVDESDPEAVKAAEAAGRTRDPVTGKFTKAEKKEPTAEETAAAAKKAADEAEAAKKAGKKEPDAINDPIPKDAPKKTQERIRTLITQTKAADEKARAATDDKNFLMNKIVQSTATPQQYNDVLEVVRLVNSTDPADQRKAIEYVQAQLVEMARRAGVVLPGVDVLAQHADLKQKVELGQMSRHDAEEMAAMRNANAHTTQTREQQAAADREKAAFDTAKTSARAALDNLEITLQAADKNYAAKKAILTKTLQPVFAQLHPSKWAAAFQQAYAALPAAAFAPRPAPRAVPVVNSGNTPLRAGSRAGGVVKGASSMLDAVNAGIAAAAGR